MNYCSECGSPVVVRVPDGDNRERHVCDACGSIHYQNPKIVTGCVAAYGDQVLLARRAIKPRHGYWTLPAGFMENAETTQEGAVRETWEEARAQVRVQSLYTTFNLPHVNQVYMLFRGVLDKPEYAPGEESLETALFGEAEIPWDELAFPVIAETLKLYFADLKRGTFGSYAGDIVREPGTSYRRYEVVMLGE